MEPLNLDALHHTLLNLPLKDRYAFTTLNKELLSQRAELCLGLSSEVVEMLSINDYQGALIQTLQSPKDLMLFECLELIRPKVKVSIVYLIGEEKEIKSYLALFGGQLHPTSREGVYVLAVGEQLFLLSSGKQLQSLASTTLRCLSKEALLLLAPSDLNPEIKNYIIIRNPISEAISGTYGNFIQEYMEISGTCFGIGLPMVPSCFPDLIAYAKYLLDQRTKEQSFAPSAILGEGCVGPIGPVGDTGCIGPTGVIGPVGGPVGDTGCIGPTGVIGPVGSMGPISPYNLHYLGEHSSLDSLLAPLLG